MTNDRVRKEIFRSVMMQCSRMKTSRRIFLRRKSSYSLRSTLKCMSNEAELIRTFSWRQSKFIFGLRGRGGNSGQINGMIASAETGRQIVDKRRRLEGMVAAARR